MAKRLHAGAQSKKHGCGRCGNHKRIILTFQRKTGRLYTLCGQCAKSTGRQRCLTL